jgi:F-type H+-transporting ATPase subunit delta
MLSRSSAVAKTILSRTTRGVAARSFSSEATEAATSVSLNLSVPYESIYNGAKVESVIIPGTEGEYGVSANHVPYVAQMKPGILTVMFDATESEKYFVAGGYAVTHANSVTVSNVTKSAQKAYGSCYYQMMK